MFRIRFRWSAGRTLIRFGFPASRLTRADQEIYATIVNWSGFNQFHLLARGTKFNSGDFTNTFYSLECIKSTNTIRLVKTVGGTDTEIDTVSQVISNGDSVWLKCLSSTITGYYKSSGAGTFTEILSVTDTSIVGGGQVGMIMNVSNGSTAIIDNVGGGTIPAVAGAPTDITGKGKAPFRSAWALLQDGGGSKNGASFLSKTVFYGDTDTADRNNLLDYFLSEPQLPVTRRIFNIS